MFFGSQRGAGAGVNLALVAAFGILAVLVSGVFTFVASLAVVSLLRVTRLLVASLLVSALLACSLLAAGTGLCVT